MRPLEVERMTVAEYFEIGQRLDDELCDFPGDVRRAKQDQGGDVLKT